VVVLVEALVVLAVDVLVQDVVEVTEVVTLKSLLVVVLVELLVVLESVIMLDVELELVRFVSECNPTASFLRGCTDSDGCKDSELSKILEFASSVFVNIV
jgi:hypothetical protein